MNGSARARGLGAELRQLRNGSGYKQEEVAKRLGLSKATMSRIESGAKAVTEADVSAILAVLGVTGEDRNRLLKLVREQDQPGWWETGVPGLPKQLTGLLEFERDASQIGCLGMILVPGLLQTSDYVRAVMRGSGVDAADIEARVAIRIGRQEILTKPTPVVFHALIDASVLRRVVGGPRVMAEQLRHILKMARRRNVTIQVIPEEVATHPGLEGSFVLLEFPKARSIVHLEQRRLGAFLDEPADVADYKKVLDTLQRVALSPADSAKLIATRADELEG
ncbi:Helix-turn-helix domain-containing protein [Saccharopolyspora shandongensis]|uniref:Helix-turn-helix domain-containing protein n=1 Tax=Saccharopolyspora shandongensis TaxID=418495 RepID=A0A1H3T603_9PSEU|nr:helix-turn-helix transcriptional regulator [Saccharopolyspora shandongensis]SDZ45490.1 Helix-turn-helix domain-containing protein [Saccharopolyspora shandongensis]